MRTTLFVTVALIIALSQVSGGGNGQNSETLGIEKRLFGRMPDGSEVHEYTLQNSAGIKMSVITYGAIMRTLFLPDRNGQQSDVVLGYGDLVGYLENNPYFGSIIGRYGNRIAAGKFSLDGIEYQLATNNFDNHLHGGERGFDKVVWKAKAKEGEEAVALELSYLSRDMEEGYPGNLYVTVTYELTRANDLIISYRATTDKKTIVNLTNHTYFNLNPSHSDILEHQLQLNASRYLPVDETLIPKNLEAVESTPFDFTESKAIGRDIALQDEQLYFGKGYDHCWVIDQTEEKLANAATLYDPETGRKVEVLTDEPGIQFYSGNFLDGTIKGKGGRSYGFRSGLCLETQHFPDSPNRPEFPSTVLEPGAVYTSKTIYRFSRQ